jgi:hypothetical protein
MIPGKFEEKYPTLEEATEAGIKYLKENLSDMQVALQEFDEKGLQRRGRIIFHVGKNFHFVNTEWI